MCKKNNGARERLEGEESMRKAPGEALGKPRNSSIGPSMDNPNFEPPPPFEIPFELLKIIQNPHKPSPEELIRWLSNLTSSEWMNSKFR